MKDSELIAAFKATVEAKLPVTLENLHLVGNNLVFNLDINKDASFNLPLYWGLSRIANGKMEIYADKEDAVIALALSDDNELCDLAWKAMRKVHGDTLDFESVRLIDPDFDCGATVEIVATIKEGKKFVNKPGLVPIYSVSGNRLVFHLDDDNVDDLMDS